MKIQVLLSIIAVFVFGTKLKSQNYTLEVLQDPVFDATYLNSIAQDSQGVMWFAGLKLVSYDGSSFNLLDAPNFGGFGNVVCGFNGELWVGGENGLFKFSNNTWDTIILPSTGTLSDMVLDKNGNLWCAFKNSDGKLAKYDGTQWISYATTSNGTALDAIVSLAIDNNNNVWIGLDNAIIRFSGTIWKLFNDVTNPEISVLGLYVFNIKAAQDNTVWADTGEGLIFYNGTTWKKPQTVLFENALTTAFAIDQQGIPWIASGDVFLFHEVVTSEYEYVYFPGHNFMPVTKMFVDKNNRIWSGGINSDTLYVITKPVSSTSSQTKSASFNLQIAPNPATNYLRLSFDVPIPSKGKLEIFDGLGKRRYVYEGDFASEKSIEIITTNYVPGLYHAILSLDNAGFSTAGFMVIDN